MVTFCIFFQKSQKNRPKKGSPNRPIPVANASLGGSTFRTPKNRCVKLPVSTSMCPPPYFPLAKMNYFPDEEEERRRTNISDFALPKVMALRAKKVKTPFLNLFYIEIQKGIKKTCKDVFLNILFMCFFKKVKTPF